jgi:DNA-binding winged helix-turn-helix (wHTH) protein/tetratricopeptide (TPR) repeat protein
MPTEQELQDGFTLGDWEILPGKGVFRRGDQEVRPEPKVFAVLMSLAQRDTNVVLKQELIDEVWDGRPTADEPITRCVYQLRRHLDDRENHELIETLQRRGYRLKKSVVLHCPAEPEVAPAAIQPGPSPRMWRIVAAILAIGFIGIAAYPWIKTWIMPPPTGSIAVMPFQNLSGVESDEYLVLGFKEELVQILQGLENYTVKNGRVSYEEEAEDIARMLGVESLLFGALRRSGDALKINYRISQGGNIIHGGDIEGTVEDLFPLQESLAIMVRNNLVGDSKQTLIKSRPSDSDAYSSYLRGVFALEHRGDPGNLEKAIELFKDAIRLDENFGPSYLALASVYLLMPTYRGEPVDEMDALALATIDAGVAADSAIEDAAGAIYGYVYKNQKRWAEAEEAYLQAVSADVVDSNAFNWYSRMLASVGRLDDSLTLILKALEIDPSSAVINSRTAVSYGWLMDNENALEYYERANDLGWSGPTHILSYAFVLIKTGQVEKARNLATSAVQMAGGSTGWIGPVFVALDDPAAAPAAIDALNAVAEVQPILPFVELTLRAMLGDTDGAMAVAELLDAPGEQFEMDLLFIPELQPLRRHPGFMSLLERLGIADYWESKGCIWSGDQVSCPEISRQ